MTLDLEKLKRLATECETAKEQAQASITAAEVAIKRSQEAKDHHLACVSALNKYLTDSVTYLGKEK